MFSLTIHPLISKLVSAFNVWYLDDDTLGGSPQSVLADFTSILNQSSSLGLSLNLSKCKVYITSASSSHFVNEVWSVAPGVRLLDSSEVTLLGSPITLEALTSSFESKLSCIQTLMSRLKTLFAHDAFTCCVTVLPFQNFFTYCVLLHPGGFLDFWRNLMVRFILAFKLSPALTSINLLGLSLSYLLQREGWGSVVQWI